MPQGLKSTSWAGVVQHIVVWSPPRRWRHHLGRSQWQTKHIKPSGRSGALAPLALAEDRSLSQQSGLQRKLPQVDWTRYHLNILFVDRSDNVRARLAVGMFERIAEWNGFGRVLIADNSGVDVIEQEREDFGKMVTLCRLAEHLRIRIKLFTEHRECFTAEDLTRYDLVVALDSSVQADILHQAAGSNPELVQYYADTVPSLTDFADYCGELTLLKPGGSGLLDRHLRGMLQPHLQGLQGITDIGLLQPDMQNWDELVREVTTCCAGLVKYLIDVYPDDLVDYDPL